MVQIVQQINVRDMQMLMRDSTGQKEDQAPTNSK